MLLNENIFKSFDHVFWFYFRMAAIKQICITIGVLFLFCIIYMIITSPGSIPDDTKFETVTLSDTIEMMIKDSKSNTQQNLNVRKTERRNICVWSHDLLGVWHPRMDICKSVHKDTVTTLVTPFGNLPIHVHDPQKDIWVSRRIINTGSFDKDKILTISKFMESDPNLNFIDIGANLGTYSLSFAKLGRKVIAIDALNLNVQKLCASVNQSHFEDVYLIMNAVSSRHETVSLGADDKNFGGTFIDQNADYIKSVKGKTVSGRHYSNISTIVLDDLLTLPFINLFPKVFIKMDIEGFEHKALERAYQFFDKIFVQGIQIEWIFHRNKSSGQIIVNFLEQHSFIPYNPKDLRQLRKSSMGNWPTQDVIWLRK